MRSLLTGGIKAILAIAALSTAAHWVLRVQRAPQSTPLAAPAGLAAIPDPVATGSITPRKVERSAAAELAAKGFDKALDQDHLQKLILGATEKKPPGTRTVAKR